MEINVRAPLGRFGSLPYCAYITKHYLERMGYKVTVSSEYQEGKVNVLIDETLHSILYERKAELWWTDTPCMIPNHYHNLKKHLDKGLFKLHYVTSEFMVKHCNELGIPVHGYVYRLMDPVLFNYAYVNENKEYDLIIIGNKCMCDRKRIALARNVVLKNNIKSVFITNGFIPSRPYIYKIGFGRCSSEKKAILLNKSRFLLWLSKCEGFGMPPLEAMICGCVPIYTDCPAHNEFTYGIKIPVKDKVKVGCYGVRIYSYVIDEKEAEEIILNALSMSKEEYVNLAEECIERAIEIHNETLNKFRDMIERI